MLAPWSWRSLSSYPFRRAAAKPKNSVEASTSWFSSRWKRPCLSEPSSCGRVLLQKTQVSRSARRQCALPKSKQPRTRQLNRRPSKSCLMRRKMLRLLAERSRRPRKSSQVAMRRSRPLCEFASSTAAPKKLLSRGPSLPSRLRATKQRSQRTQEHEWLKLVEKFGAVVEHCKCIQVHKNDAVSATVSWTA